MQQGPTRPNNAVGHASSASVNAVPRVGRSSVSGAVMEPCFYARTGPATAVRCQIYRERPHVKTVISMGTTPSSTISSCLAAA